MARVTEPIAIIGLGCRFPKANSPEAFWDLLVTGIDAIREIPSERFSVDQLYDSRPATPGRIMTRWGGFLDGIELFDAGFFGMSPREAERLDPQQRLLLETTWEALEAAGQVPAQLRGSETAVFVGIWLNEYENRMFRDPGRIDFYMTTGTGRYTASGRISHVFGWHGPSVTVDCACSSSLVAVHLACQSLRSGECELAVAGGANVLLEPSITLAYSQSRMMAPDGRCKFGDARANGYVRSDGAGVVVLKPLSRALADGDPIEAVILGSAVNNDGDSSGSLGTPARAGQEDLLRKAYRDASVAPVDVDYVEAHGTGTRAGDPVEIQALASVLGEGRLPNRPLVIGSVKTNIGHTEGAAGVAGLIKVASALKYRTIPRNLHLETPNPDIPWSTLCVEIPLETRAWPDAGRPGIAGVSSFGIAGTNAHIVLQRYVADPLGSPPEAAVPRARLVPLSAHSPEALRAMAQRWEAWLAAAGPDRPSTADVAATAALRRQHHDHRLAVVVDGPEALLERLHAFGESEPARGMASGERLPGASPRVVFVCPGQGSQWLGMGRQLLEQEPVFREALARCDAAIQQEAGWSLLAALRAEAGAAWVDDIAVIQPALFAMEIGLAELWCSWGITPAAVVGHSMGEAAAAYLAGALSLEEAVRVICRRSAFMKRVSGRGAMAVVGLTLDEARAAVADWEGQLSVAVSNSVRSTVLSGEPTAIDAVLARLEARGVFCRRIKVDVASHSPQMDPIRGELVASLAGLTPGSANVPMCSTVTGTFVDGKELDASYWGRNLREPVLFSTVVERLARDGYCVFLELSPHPLLVSAIQEQLRECQVPGGSFPSLHRDEDERFSLLEALGGLYVAGCEPAWSRIVEGGSPHTALPPYPWQRERFWYEAETGSAASNRGRGFGGTRVSSSLEPGTHFWDCELSLLRYPFLADHKVNGLVVLPAAAFVEIALEALADVRSTGVVLEDLVLDQALVLPSEGTRTLQVAVSQGPPGALLLRISSRDSSAEDETASWIRHARGLARAAADGDTTAGLTAEEGGTEFPPASHYEAMAARRIEYGPSFQGIQELSRCAERVSGRIALPDGIASDGFRIHPALLDACFQLGVASLPETTAGDTYMPVGIERLRLFHTPACDLPLRAEVIRRSDEAGGSGTAFAVDGALHDASGAPVLEFQGLRLARLDRDFRGVQQSLFSLRWESQARSARRAEEALGAWLILGDNGGTGAAVGACLKARGAEVTVLAAGEANDLTAALHGRSFRGVVHFGSLDAQSPASAGLPALAQARAAGCESVLCLAQALNAEGGTQSPRLWLVTAGAQTVRLGESPAVAQSPLWGLGRVIANEHPELRCTLVDISAAPVATEIESLVEEFASECPDDQVGLRGKERFGLHLVPWQPSAGSDAAAPLVSPAAGRPFRAVVSSPGILDNIILRAAERRAPGRGQVEIEVQATGLNFMNVMSALGVLPGYPDGVGPLGIECAGRVSALGEGVEGLQVGDLVLGVAFDSLATHAIADARLVRVIPAGWSAAQAATIPIAFLTAHYALNHLGRLAAGERVLIHAAAGGVGMAAVQLAQHAGAEVFATAGTPEKRALIESLGVRHVMDSRSLSFREEVLARTGGEGVDVVLNSLAGEFIEAGFGVLRPYGRFLEIGKRDIYRNAQIGLGPFQRSLAYFAIDLDRMSRERAPFVGKLLDELMALAQRGALHPLPHRAFPVSQVADAFRHMAQAKHTGKVVVSIRDPEAKIEERHAKLSAFVRGTCLITGGLGGLGLAIARWLVEKGARSLALVGRREPGEAARETIEALRRAGARVHVAQGDVSSEVDMRRILVEIETDLPSVSGVVHAAGLLDDGILLQQTPERFAAVMAPKVEGAWVLQTLLAERPDVPLVLFSSVAGLLGLPGQGNYAAGNAFLDALASYRNARGEPGMAINWGPWADVGLAAARENRGQRLSLQGLPSLSVSEGLSALGMLLEESVPQVAVARFDWAKYAAASPASARSTLLAHLAAEKAVSPAGSSAATDGLRERLLAAEAGSARRLILETYLREQVAQVLKLAPTRIDLNKPFRSLGLDSLMALELRNRLEAGLKLALPATLVWNYPTVAALTPHLAERLDVPLEGERATLATPETDEVGTLLDEIERLSPEEARGLLDQEGARGDGQHG